MNPTFEKVQFDPEEFNVANAVDIGTVGFVDGIL